MQCNRRVAFLSSVALVGLATAQSLAPAFAATAPLSNPQVVAHFNISTLQQPENITLEPSGSAIVTFNRSRQIARVTTSGVVTILATLPAPASGTATASGIVRAVDGTLYVNYNAGVLSGIWRVPASGGTPVQFVALPDVANLNGLAIDPAALYATDSASGTVWKISLSAGTVGAATLWAQGTALQRNTTGSSGFGANGIKVHNGAVWVSNTDKGTLMSIPINANGTPGTLVTKATGITSIDDFAFTSSGDVLAAQNFLNAASIIHPDGTHLTVLTSTDGLSNPTSVAINGSKAYVASGAYFTGVDPNLLLATIG
jgi:sugar lactone lactonase YvrE